jgi:hypothetical protein
LRPDIPTFCIQCTAPVPEDRVRRRAVTCSEECFQNRRAATRKKVNTDGCRFCHRPSTPAQRGRYTRWEALQRRVLGMASLEILRAELPALAKILKERGEPFNQKQVADLLMFLVDETQGGDLRKEPRTTTEPTEAAETIEEAHALPA